MPLGLWGMYFIIADNCCLFSGTRTYYISTRIINSWWSSVGCVHLYKNIKLEQYGTNTQHKSATA